jgi:HD superfamily phosphohydrolase
MDDHNNVLRMYREASRSETHPASLLALVRRYNLPWFGIPCLTEGHKTVEIRQSGLQPITPNPVLCYKSLLRGDEENEILHRVRKMATLPQFYRLNWIRQLSTTSLAINLDGSHNRLSHCLGTLDIASRFVAVLRKQLQPVEVKAILIYAFIHDTFHGPMGHTMDLIKDVIWGARVQERIDKHLLLTHIEKSPTREAGFLWRAVRANVADSDRECEAIFEYLENFLFADAKTKNFMAEIVDSDLDADRLDYIWRDHVHLLMSNPDIDHRQVEDLIASIAVIEEPKGETHIYFGSEYSEVVERILDLRVRFYTRFYEHPIKVVADEMLTHAIYYILEQEGMLDSSGGMSESHKEFAEQFSYLTDDGLFHFLDELTAKEAHLIPYALVQDVRANRPFEIVYQKGLKRENFVTLTRRFAALDYALDSIQREESERIKSYVRNRTLGLFDRPQYEAIIARYNERASQSIMIDDDDPQFRKDPSWQGAELPYTEEDDIYRIQLLYGGGFRKKILLERLLWQDLQRNKAFSDALVKVALGLCGRRRADADYVQTVMNRLRKTPLTFIGLSWIPGITDHDLANHKRGFSPYGLRFHKDRQPFTMEAELTIKSRDEDYLLTICAPEMLLRPPGMKELIAKSFDEFLKRRAWILPDALQYEMA